MAVIAGDLVTRLGVDGRRFQRGLDKARGDTRSFAADVTRIVSGIAIADIGKRAIGGIIDLTTSVVNLAASAQTAQITFEVLTGDAAKGAKLFKDIEKFAARTSFDLMSAADATKALLAAGVADTDVMSTMQLLGDLAMGDAEKLGFLSKAYTDVMNKGKLQGQELRQFAENGVGLAGALAASMNKTTAQILKMSEDGLISFDDMKKALQGLTGEGGRFNNMMARINETFTGQWNSLIENIQTFGRDLGALVLPKLTQMLNEINKIVAAVNSFGDAKWEFISQVLTASFDVAIEQIKTNWKQMLRDILDETIKNANLIEAITNPVTGAQDLIAAAMNRNEPVDANAGVKGAQERLDALLAKLDVAKAANAPAAGVDAANADPLQAAREARDAALQTFEDTLNAAKAATAKQRAALEQWDATPITDANYEAIQAAYYAAEKISDQAGELRNKAESEFDVAKANFEKLNQEKQKQESQDKFNSGISSMFGKVKDSVNGGLLGQVAGAAQGVFERTKIKAGAFQGMFENWFGSPDWNEETKDAAAKQEPQLAGAMAAGSQEAFSTIFAAMLQRGKDPNVTATEKQTKELKRALRDNRPQNAILMGIAGL